MGGRPEKYKHVKWKWGGALYGPQVLLEVSGTSSPNGCPKEIGKVEGTGSNQHSEVRNRATVVLLAALTVPDPSCMSRVTSQFMYTLLGPL